MLRLYTLWWTATQGSWYPRMFLASALRILVRLPVVHKSREHFEHGLPTFRVLELIRVIQFWVVKHLQAIPLPPEANVVRASEIAPYFSRVNNLVLAAEDDRSVPAREVLPPENVLRPEEVARERARDVGVAAREVPQLPLARGARRAVDEVVRDGWEVEQERDGVDQHGGAYARGERGVPEDVGGEDGPVGVPDEHEGVDVVVLQDARECGEHVLPIEERRGDVHADGEVLDSDDTDVGV